TAAVGPHRTGAASAGVLRSAGPSQHRMVPRPRAHRAAPLRRLTSAKAWMHPPQSHETGPWAEFEGPRCRALIGPLKTNAAGGPQPNGRPQGEWNLRVAIRVRSDARRRQLTAAGGRTQATRLPPWPE